MPSQGAGLRCRKWPSCAPALSIEAASGGRKRTRFPVSRSSGTTRATAAHRFQGRSAVGPGCSYSQTLRLRGESMALPERKEPYDYQDPQVRQAARRTAGARLAWWWLWIVIVCLAIWWAGWGWGGSGGWWWGHRGAGYGTNGAVTAPPNNNGGGTATGANGGTGTNANGGTVTTGPGASAAGNTGATAGTSGRGPSNSNVPEGNAGNGAATGNGGTGR